MPLCFASVSFQKCKNQKQKKNQQEFTHLHNIKSNLKSYFSKSLASDKNVFSIDCIEKMSFSVQSQTPNEKVQALIKAQSLELLSHFDES